MSAATKRLGIVITMSTIAYPPFLLARLSSTLDHISSGRFGWNIVTSAEDYRGAEFWDGQTTRRASFGTIWRTNTWSWSTSCSIRGSPARSSWTARRGIYADYKKVHPINFKGQFFKCRGPLNTARSPQGRPVYVQAGGSPRGREFAAKHADSIITLVDGIEGMKWYRNDIRERAATHGRNPDDIKVLYLVIPTLGETKEQAYAKRERMISSPAFIEQTLALVSAITDIDFSKFDLDSVLPHLTTNGEQGSLDKFQQSGSGKTLRQVGRRIGGIRLFNRTDRHARPGCRSHGRDHRGSWRRWIPDHDSGTGRQPHRDPEVTDGLVPALQRRGLVRSAYAYPTLRENLRDF